MHLENVSLYVDICKFEWEKIEKKMEKLKDNETKIHLISRIQRGEVQRVGEEDEAERRANVTSWW